MAGTDDLEPALARAAAVAGRLNDATENLNRALAKTEKALASMNLGVRAGVNLEPDDDPDWHQILVFGKHNSGWRLLIESGPGPGGRDGWREAPLLNASREIRVRAVAFLPELIERLVSTAEKQVGTVSESAAQADAFAESLSK